MIFDFITRFGINEKVYTNEGNNFTLWYVKSIVFKYEENEAELVYNVVYKDKSIMASEDELFSQEEIIKILERSNDGRRS